MSLFSPTHKGLPTANPIGFPRHLPYQDGQFGGLSHFRHAHTRWGSQDS